MTAANPDARRGEASIDGRNRDGNTIIFGMLRPYRIHNNDHVNGIKKVCVCQFALSGSTADPDLHPGYFVGRNGVHSPLRQRDRVCRSETAPKT